MKLFRNSHYFKKTRINKFIALSKTANRNYLNIKYKGLMSKLWGIHKLKYDQL